MNDAFRITLECDGVPASAGQKAAQCITEQFHSFYPHEKNVLCSWDGKVLRLTAENDYDRKGLNLLDEFSDNIAGCIEPFDGELRIVSVETLA